MRILEVQGTPSEMGQAQGEAFRDAIHEFLELRVQNAVRQAFDWGGRRVDRAQLLAVAQQSAAATQTFHADGYDELVGIAQGANLSLPEVLALNGLTDFRDVLAWDGQFEAFSGCSAFMVQQDSTRSGTIIAGQTWDLATDNMPFVIGVVRQPKEGPKTWAMTTAGCLSLIGMNAHGCAVGTTNVRTPDARPGVMYLSIIHRALQCEDAMDAKTLIEGTHRSGAHFYWVVDSEGTALGIECTATLADTHRLVSGHYVHCNHCLVPLHQTKETRPPSASSLARTERLNQLLEVGAPHHTVESLKAAMADEVGGLNAICRRDTLGISTNGAVIVEPESRRIHMIHGLPSEPRQGWVSLGA